MGLILVWLGVASVLSVPLVFFARRRGATPVDLALSLIGHAIGFGLAAFGGLALLFDGYVEDYGMEPAETTGVGEGFIAAGLFVLVAAWGWSLVPRD